MVVSDHGMASGNPQSGAEYVEIDDYLDMDDVSYVIDRAAIAAVAPLPGKADKVNSFHPYIRCPRPVSMSGSLYAQRHANTEF